MTSKIWVSPPHMTGEELNYIESSITGNWISSTGPYIDKFEDEIKYYLDNKIEVAALNSGTSAIHLALIQLGIKEGDEVICQSFTFSASANPILYLKAKPIFVDSEEETWNMCPILLEEAIEDRIKKGKKPKAIIAVHLYGMPYKVNQIHSIANKYSIPMIEDAAEAFGSSYNKIKCGSFGDFGILSFNGNKIITTSSGGALLCKSKSIKKNSIYLATQAKDDAPHYQHSKIGYNYRMSNILAGIGLAQIKVLDKRVKARREIFKYYYKNLNKELNISFSIENPEMYSNRWMTTILTKSFEQREKIRLALEKNNIESKPLWKPLHLQPVFTSTPKYCNGVSVNLFKKGLCLPSGSNLSKFELEQIVGIIKNSLFL
ncbi:pyridoxal phosphate-dependent aminotransferase [Aureibaculum marinum]|uniref:Pyridoxal phosphate-dependent aminotransferase n=1 Tax=Aureibaculum marinum TaxID=2487930 RepID=A0A3N4NST8_9FLAO|nr:DegT/DnrJ/EryC1/StrS family aminotransferase [Aureibaculum marinum]RPD98795.1 pyridoxal phosphate-dependent aminotransferase [Aureibaculum marinum]